MSVTFGVESLGSDLSWNTRISRTRLSTVDGLSLSAAPVLTAQGLDQLLRTIQQLGLNRYSFEELQHEAVVGEGESFRVERCLYNKAVVAVKHVKLDHTQTNVQSSYHRLQSVLLEIQIMRHNPLKDHPNILSALGYGWMSHGERLLPYVVVEYAAHGSMRAWLREKERDVKTKFKLAGDIASGLKALHVCDIIHGDLKLDNILVVPAPTRAVQVVAKLCDFGHSIILRKGTRDFKYFGTILYNAPEVELQESSKIEPENLHKCDIFAYGLAVWELFANGARYFDPKWSIDPAYTSEAFEPPPPMSPSLSSASLRTESTYVVVSHDESRKVSFSDKEAQSALGSFSHKHLQSLSKAFVATLFFPGLTIEKGYLRKLLQNTLQYNPALRPSQITLVPTMMDWDRSDQGALQEQLALHTGSSALTFEIFRFDQEFEVPWEYKRKIFQDLISLAEHQGTQDQAATAASTSLQASFCYIVGFGTSPNAQSATRFLQKAIELQSPMAQLFGKRLLEAIDVDAEADTLENLSPEPESYTKNIIDGFRADRPEIKGVELHDHDGALLVGPEKFKNYAALKVFLQALNEKQREKTIKTFVITMPFSIRMDLLSLAIAMDDVATVQKFAKIFTRKKVTTPHEETPLIQACRRGSVEMVVALLEAGADPSIITEDGCSFYHWLFMLGDRVDEVVNKLQSLETTGTKELLDHVCHRAYILHPQWPLKLVGTPLTFAIECNSIPAVKALLKLGASPRVPSYEYSETPSSFEWTSLHLAFKFHLADIIRLLLKDEAPCLSPDQEPELSVVELARSICYSTQIERIAMHGANGRKTALEETLRMIHPSVLSTPSEDGQTPFMQAIDFSNIDVVNAMMAADPTLYNKVFIDPEDATIFTYPAIFAAQIAAKRDSSDAFEIVKLLLKHIPSGTKLRDSQGRTPLHFSVTGCSTQTTKWLLTNGYSHSELDTTGRAPIHNCRSTASLNILLDLGADINQRDANGHTVLHTAALRGFEDLIEGLIFQDADLTAQGTLGTALHSGVLAQSRRVMSLLIKADNGHGNKLPINGTDSAGNTALHVAARMLRPDLLLLLFAANIDRSIRNAAGETAKSQLGPADETADPAGARFVNSYRNLENPNPDPEADELAQKVLDELGREDTDPEAVRRVKEEYNRRIEEKARGAEVEGEEKEKEEIGEREEDVGEADTGEDEDESGNSDTDTASFISISSHPAPASAKPASANTPSHLPTTSQEPNSRPPTYRPSPSPPTQPISPISPLLLLRAFQSAEEQYIHDVLKWSKHASGTLPWGDGMGTGTGTGTVQKKETNPAAYYNFVDRGSWRRGGVGGA